MEDQALEQFRLITGRHSISTDVSLEEQGEQALTKELLDVLPWYDTQEEVAKVIGGIRIVYRAFLSWLGPVHENTAIYRACTELGLDPAPLFREGGYIIEGTLYDAAKERQEP